jgi:hypothetical protein
MSDTVLVILWVALGLATLGLAGYRKLVTRGERDVLHLRESEKEEIPQQVALFSRLQRIDRWGKTLTVVTLVAGLGLAGMFLYRAWQDPGSVPNTFYRR